MAFKETGIKEIDAVSIALNDLLSSPKYAELDAKYACSQDLIYIGNDLQIKRETAERFRVGRANQVWYVHEVATRTPDRIAVWFEGKTWTYLQLARIVGQVADWLTTHGVRKGDPVAMIQGNTEAFIFQWLGIHKIGAVACIIDSHLREPNLSHVLNLMPPVGVVLDAENLAHVLPVYQKLTTPRFLGVWNADGILPSHSFIKILSEATLPHPSARLSDPTYVDPMDIGSLLYTSGTTGLNKAWAQTAGKVSVKNKFDIQSSDRTALLTPLYHNAASGGGATGSFAAGASIMIVRKFSASQCFRQLKEAHATRILWIGEIARYLLATPPSPQDKDHYVTDCIGLGLRPEVWVQFKERFGIQRIGEWYGQVEGPLLWTNLQKRSLDGAEPDAGFVGKAGPILQSVSRFRIFRFDGDTGQVWQDPKTGLYEEIQPGGQGEIAIEIGDHRPLVGEYVGNKKATESKQVQDPLGPGSGRFWKYGDLIEQTTDWGLRFKDRLGDTFKYRGVNVATTLVESTLLTIPGVKDVSSYGVAVEGVMGRCGMVVLVTDPDTFDWKTFTQGVKDKLHKPAQPVFVRISNEETVKVSGLFKLLKVQLQKEGIDPSKVGDDKLFWFKEGEYVPFGQKEWRNLSAIKSKL